jgi:hypothetical protein
MKANKMSKITKHSRSLSFLHVILLALLILHAIAANMLIQGLRENGADVWHSNWAIVAAGLIGGAILSGILFILSFLPGIFTRLVQFVEKRLASSRAVMFAAVVIFLASVGGYAWWFILSPYRDFLPFRTDAFQILSAFVLAGWAALMFKSIWVNVDIRLIASGVVSIQGFLLKLASLLATVSATPFVIKWEENYRFYYASLLASERVYGQAIPLSPVDFSLNLLNGLPFLAGDFPIWFHRLWWVLLTLGLAGLTAWALTLRLNLNNRLGRWSLLIFLVLYFLQEGGVKYNLLVCVAIVFLGFSIRHPWRSLITVLLASFWAGLSRVNWLPVPALLAICLYLLEKRIDSKSILLYLKRPVLLGTAGLISALGAYLLVGKLPGAAHSSVETMLQQEFLWYRLLPNSTYPPGILIPVLLLSLPVFWILLTLRPKLHAIRFTGLLLSVLALLGGGILVSVKIGGGSDLHNLDAYLTLSVTIFLYVLFQKVQVDCATIGKPQVSWWMFALIVLLPFFSAAKSLQPYPSYHSEETNEALEIINQEVQEAAQEGEVLFMHQRQLLTFGYVESPLVPEYENVFLLDMALTRDETYLQKFYTDLCHRRFRLIVSEIHRNSLQGRNFAFGDENDIWYFAITRPLLEFYQLSGSIAEHDIEFYIPRPDSPPLCDFQSFFNSIP